MKGAPEVRSHERRVEDPLSPVRAINLLLSPEMDDPLDDLLRLVGEGMGVSRTYLFQFREEGQIMDNTHEWCAPGVEPQQQRLQALSSDLFPWWIRQLRSGSGVVAASLSDLPPGASAEREILEAQGIQAVLVLPLRSSEEELIGFMGFDDVTGPREWTERETDSLRTICQLGTHELERRRALIALQQLQKRLVRTERIAAVGGWEFHPENGVAWWSTQARAILGLAPDRERVTLFDFFQRVHPDDRERTRRVALKILDDGKPFRCECRVLTTTGTARHVEVQGALREGAGSALVVGTLQDVTERRLLEDQLRQAQRMDAVGKLAGGVAHDFNNLLSVILGSADLLMESLDEDDDPRRNDIAQIRQAAQSGAELTRQLRAFSRSQLLEPRSLDVNEVVSSTEGLVQRLLPEDIRLVVDTTESAGRVHADPAQLEQVILSLVVNARDAMAEKGGTLRLSTGHRQLSQEVLLGPGQRLGAGSYAVITVEDDGIGMNGEVQARVFEPFFTTKPAGEAMGLGLSSAYGIVQQSGGGIEVQSEVGAGSRFLVHLPVLLEEASAKPAERVDTPLRISSGRTILLVEDDGDLSVTIRRILERGGFEVISAQRPADAVALSEAHPGGIDLLVTDVVMPGIDGRQLADEVRRHRPGVGVLYISGHSREVIARKGIVPPGDALLTKPFTTRELLEEVHRGLENVAARERPGV